MKKLVLFLLVLLLASCQQLDNSLENQENISTGVQENISETAFGLVEDIQGENNFSLITETEEKICAKDICIDLTKPHFTVGDEVLQFVIFQEEYDSQTYTSNNKIISYVDTLPEKKKHWHTGKEEYVIDIGSNFESGGWKKFSINKKNDSGSEFSSAFLSESGKEVFQKNGIIFESDYAIGCGASSVNQKFYSAKTGERIIDPSKSLPEYPKTLMLGNFILHVDWDWWMDDERRDSFFKYDDKNSETSVGSFGEFSLKEDVSEQIKKGLEQDMKFGTYGYYKVSFKEIPGITFVYKNAGRTAFGIVKNDFSDKMIDENGNLIDLEATKKILARQDYTSDVDDQFSMNLRKKPKENEKFDYNNIKVSDLTAEMLPIYQIEKINEDLVLVRTLPQYEAYSTAELCKPLIYVYDAKKQPNSVKINFPKGGIFTKILPDFTGVNSWDFVADTQSSLVVDGVKISQKYLYYSARVPNYTFNRDGWQVYGRDIENFFNDKLDTIGFNAMEKKDFIDYWKNEFDAEKLYFVSFKFDEKIDTYVTLHFLKKPNTQMRVLLEAYPIKQSNPKFLYPYVGNKFDKYLLKKFIRSGDLDVFEWGGVLQKDFYGNLIIR